MSPDEDTRADQFPELTPFEASLAGLTPRAAALDREMFFFQAGQAAALRDQVSRQSGWTRWAWPGAFSTMTAVAATLLAMLCFRTPPIANRPAADVTTPEVAAAQAAPVVAAPGPQSEDRLAGAATYARLRDEILRHGMDAFPPEKVAATEATAVATGPLTYHQILDQILHEK